MPKVSPVRKGYSPRVVQSSSDLAKKHDELIITPAYDAYLNKHPELTHDMRAVKRVTQELLTPARDRSRSFSASSAGYCLRRQELAFLGVKQNPMHNPRLARIFGNGTMGHLRWQIGLLSARILDDIEYTVVSFSGKARATLDGIGVAPMGKYKGQRFFWEHKGRMSYSFLQQRRANLPDRKTMKQVGFQFLQTGYDLGAVTNENKDTQETDEFVIERTDAMVADARAELRELVMAVEKHRLHDMLPECLKENRTGEFFKCPFGGHGGACVNSGRWPNNR